MSEASVFSVSYFLSCFSVASSEGLLENIHTTAGTSQILGSTVKHLSLLILRDAFPTVWRISIL